MKKILECICVLFASMRSMFCRVFLKIIQNLRQKYSYIYEKISKGPIGFTMRLVGYIIYFIAVYIISFVIVMSFLWVFNRERYNRELYYINKYL